MVEVGVAVCWWDGCLVVAAEHCLSAGQGALTPASRPHPPLWSRRGRSRQVDRHGKKERNREASS